MSKIQDLRELMGSQVNLAAHLGLTQPYVSALLLGKHVPGRTTGLAVGVSLMLHEAGLLDFAITYHTTKPIMALVRFLDGGIPDVALLLKVTELGVKDYMLKTPRQVERLASMLEVIHVFMPAQREVILAGFRRSLEVTRSED